MRAVLLLLLSTCLGLTMTAQRPMVMPPALKAGDTMHLSIAKLGEQRQTCVPFAMELPR